MPKKKGKRTGQSAAFADDAGGAPVEVPVTDPVPPAPGSPAPPVPDDEETLVGGGTSDGPPCSRERPISALASVDESADYHTAESRASSAQLPPDAEPKAAFDWATEPFPPTQCLTADEPRTPLLASSGPSLGGPSNDMGAPLVADLDRFSDREDRSRASTSFGGHASHEVKDPRDGVPYSMAMHSIAPGRVSRPPSSASAQVPALSRSPSRGPSLGSTKSHNNAKHASPPASVHAHSHCKSPLAAPRHGSLPAAPEARASASFDGFVSAMTRLTADPSYRLVQDVFGELTSVRDQRDRLSISHREILEEYRRFKNALEAQEAELVAVQHQLASTVRAQKAELDGHHAARGKIEAALAAANGLLVDLGAAKARVEEELAVTWARVEELGVQTAKLEMELQVVREACETSRTEKAELETIIAMTTQEKEEMAEKKAKLESEVQWAMAEVTDLKSSKARLTEELDSTKTELNSVSQVKFTLESRLEGVERERDGLLVSQASSEADRRKLEAELAASNAELIGLRDAKLHLQRDLQSMTSELFEEKEKAKRLLLNTAAEMAELKTANAKLQSQLKAETERADDGASKAEELDQKLEETEEELHQTQAKLLKLDGLRVALENGSEDT